MPTMQTRLKKMSLRKRIAAGAFVVESVMKMYSSHFVETYQQKKVLEYAWSFARGRNVSKRRRDALLEQAASAWDDDDYDFQDVWMGGFLLEEIDRDDAVLVVRAIEAASSAFASQQIYRQRLSDVDSRITMEQKRSIEEPVKAFAEEVLKFVETIPEEKLGRRAFSSLKLDTSLQPFMRLNLKVTKKGLRPPVHESPENRQAD